MLYMAGFAENQVFFRRICRKPKNLSAGMPGLLKIDFL
jgi:hypothetical protein